MKLYKKILGILTLLIALVGFCFLVYIMIDGHESDRISALFLFIPVYAIIHYTILTQFGFDNSPVESSRVNLFGLIFVLLLVLVFPFRYGIEYFKTQNRENSLRELKDWGIDVNNTCGIKGNLKTKYSTNELFYKLSLNGLSDSLTNVDYIGIHFEDKDLFMIKNLQIPIKGDVDILTLERNDSLYLTINGSIKFDSEVYQNIQNWELLCTNKKSLPIF